eukprot:CAMPEP_0116022802 /NCGR_PEP_ID=MMETSP0321-20121206/11198_1 /TAXON_ID=163516 /ORGANISM="Leptocylindrus danicus var. danicus, Strain B650" /LENGTH=474 /DNA_ID=CAMNT_0003493931 /DNA_START=284 /DNA_END=1709 /DNA_ORIENTATION=+
MPRSLSLSNYDPRQREIKTNQPMLQSATLSMRPPVLSCRHSQQTITSRRCYSEPFTHKEKQSKSNYTAAALVINDSHYKGGRWRITKPLPFIPAHYPLAGGYCTVFVPNIDGSTIAHRISSYLRLQSIYANFSERNNFTSALCESMDRITFEVRLFASRGKGCNSNYAHGVIVEMRRRSGDSLAFFRYRCAITLVAQGKATAQELAAKANERPLYNSVLDPMEVDEEEDKMLCQEALEDVLCLLREERQNTEMLAMESLRNLTDATKSSESIAQEASNQLLQDIDDIGEDNASTGRVIFEHLTKYLQADRLSEGDKSRFHFEENHINGMKYFSLQILDNAMSNLSEGYVSVDDEHMLSLVPAMVEELKHADVRPHGAYFATRCLDSMLKYSPESIDWNNLSSELELALMNAILLVYADMLVLKMLRAEYCTALTFAKSVKCPLPWIWGSYRGNTGLRDHAEFNSKSKNILPSVG